MRGRVIALDPTEGVQVPTTYGQRAAITTISRADFLRRLLPTVPQEHRALVATAAGAGLRWGECVGLTWGRVDLAADELRVVQIAEETSGAVVLRSLPPDPRRCAVGPHDFRAAWRDVEGIEWSKEFTTERDAVAHVAEVAAGGLRFHDLRHSYATWLVSAGVPVNVAQRMLGHQNAWTTLNVYTHAPGDHLDRIRNAFAGDADDSLANNPDPGV